MTRTNLLTYSLTHLLAYSLTNLPGMPEECLPLLPLLPLLLLLLLLLLTYSPAGHAGGVLIDAAQSVDTGA